MQNHKREGGNADLGREHRAEDASSHVARHMRAFRQFHEIGIEIVSRVRRDNCRGNGRTGEGRSHQPPSTPFFHVFEIVQAHSQRVDRSWVDVWHGIGMRKGEWIIYL